MKPTTVVVASNTAWSIVNFRRGLIRALLDAGCEVIAVAAPDEYVGRLKGLGCCYLPLPIDGSGTKPGRDLLLLWRLWGLLGRLRPDALLAFTVKPNVYGSLIAGMLGIPAVNNITGLGTAFAKRGWLRLVVGWLYRLALARAEVVFFQNDDDRRLFVRNGLVQARKTDIVPGSGVDVRHFTFTPVPVRPHRFRFLLIARMMWIKGVGEYVKAARIVKRHFRYAEFCLVGPLVARGSAAVSQEQINVWVAEGVIRYLGSRDDIREEIEEADCIVLPSNYREGVPRVLLEGAAMGRPIITTDSVGCREVVEDGVNGFLCRVQDVGDLGDKMKQMLRLPREARAKMGLRGREKVETEFDEQIVIHRYLEVIAELTEKRLSVGT